MGKIDRSTLKWWRKFESKAWSMLKDSCRYQIWYHNLQCLLLCKVIISKSRGEPFSWNRISDLGCFSAGWHFWKLPNLTYYYLLLRAFFYGQFLKMFLFKIIVVYALKSCIYEILRFKKMKKHIQLCLALLEIPLRATYV